MFGLLPIFGSTLIAPPPRWTAMWERIAPIGPWIFAGWIYADAKTTQDMIDAIMIHETIRQYTVSIGAHLPREWLFKDIVSGQLRKVMAGPTERFLARRDCQKYLQAS